MSKLIVSPNSLETIPEIIDKVDGLMLGCSNLSTSVLTVNIDDIKKLRQDYPHQELVIVLNKMMHNQDLPIIEQTLQELDTIKVDKILFYDLSVFSIAHRLNIKVPLVIWQEHLNASIGSNNFYYQKGIQGTYITDDITLEEITEIRNNYSGIMYKTIYGYLPLFYSRRYLITNYMKYINQNPETGTHYIHHNDDYYPIMEHDYGTIIYTKEPINIIKDKAHLEALDYHVILGMGLDNKALANIIDAYRNDSSASGYEGFLNTKTIYKIKN